MSSASSKVRCPARRVVLAGRQERRLDDEQVRVPRRLDQRLVGAGVAGHDDEAAGAVADRAAPGRDVVATGQIIDRQIADLDAPVGVVLSDFEGVVEEAGPLADRRRQLVELAPAARWQEDRYAAAGEPGPRHQVAQRDEVDVVVGVKVADDDRVELARIAQWHEPPDHALAAIDQHGRGGGLDENPGRRGLRLRGGRACADDRDAGHG
jgi:hypothetical protein